MVRPGPEQTAAALASHFEALSQRGLMRVDDPLLAGHHFHWLVVSVPLNKLMFGGPEPRTRRAELQHFADEAVRVFLAAYGRT